jgi:hypothetical protein
VTTLVAAAALRDQSSPGVVSQTLNQPQVAGELRLLMERAGMGWSSRAELTFEVQEGELDELRMEIPQEWADVKPQGTDLEIELRKLPGQPRQHLILRPLKPWTGTQTLELRGMLATTDGGVRVPEVRVLDYDDWKRFVVLPTRFEKQRIRWTLNGLENVAWPKEEMPPVNQELYRLTGTRYSAVIEDVEYDVGQPGVLLAEAVIRVHDHDDLWGELAWELIPNGERSCTIVMPPALHLLHVQLDGSSAVVQVQTEGTWRVNLASHDLPQRVTVAFSAPVPEPQTMLELPTLRGLAVEKTSWIVQGKRSASSQPGAERALTQEAMQQLTESLEAQANALKIAGGTELTNESPEFAADWFQARHLQWQRTQLSLHHMLEQGRVPGDLNTRIKAAEVLWEQGTLLFQQPAAVAGIDPSLTTIPLRQCQLYAGWMPRQVIDVSTPPSSLQNRTWLWGALLLLVGIGGCWFLARPRGIAANLSAVGMLAGCGAVAVLALQPTWIGILLLAVAAVWQVSQRKLTVRRAISR